MAEHGEHQVTAPDQHRRASIKWIRIAGIFAILSMLLMLRPFNNHEGWAEDALLLLTAGVIAALLVGDAIMRRNGLRP